MTTETTSATNRLVPLREGMFLMPGGLDGPAILLGSHCRNCGESFFPRRVFCAACSSGEMDLVELANTGEIETFTVVHQQPPNSVMEPPYAIVRIRLDNGPAVQTVVPTAGLARVAIGARAQLVVRRIRVDEAGDTVVSFMAQPVQS